jgi:hypothetical protein
MRTLIDRYIDEAASQVGAGTRDEVRRDLHGMVDELVEARVAQGEPEGTATERALNELGDPRRFARDYTGERRYLIGPRHYDEYIGLLKAIASLVLPLVAIVAFAAQVLVGEGNVGSLVGNALAEALWITFMGGVQIAFWVTVVFAIMERQQRPDTTPDPAAEAWTVADLPPAKTKRQISIGDALTGLGFTLFVGVILILVYRNGINMYLSDQRSAELGRTVPIFNPDIPTAVAWLVIGLLAADALVEVVKYAVGYWTRVIAFTQVALNGVWIGVVMAILGAWDLVNPGIRGAVDDGVADIFLDSWFEQSVLATALVVSVIAIWEAVRGYLAWRKSDDEWSV